MSVLQGDEVQIGPVECPVSRLSQIGTAFQSCLDQLGVPDDPEGLEAFSSLPQGGWRVLNDQTGDGGEHTSWIATPGPSGWLLASVTKEDDRWFVYPWGVEEGAIPSKGQRGRGLEIRVPESCREWRAGDRPQLEVELMNHGPGIYPCNAQDTTFVYGKLSTVDGDDLENENGIAYSPLDFQEPIGVGDSRRMPVHLLTRNVQQLAVGDYSLVVSLLTLGLDRSCTVRISPSP